MKEKEHRAETERRIEMDKCDCERQGAKNSHRVLIGDADGNLETVAECCPLCVIETIGEVNLGTMLADKLRAASDKLFDGRS